MKNRVLLLTGLFAALLMAAGTDLTSTKNLIVKGRGIVGPDTMLSNVGFDINTYGMTGLTQIGTYINPVCNSAANAGCIGLKVKPKVAVNSGTVANVDVINIDNPFIGGASRVNWMRGLHIGRLFGADSGTWAIDVDGRKSRFGDSVQINGLLTLGGGLELHQRLVGPTPTRFGDSDCVIYFDLTGGDIHDTLPNMYTCLGKVMHFIQKGTSAGKFVLHAKSGQKIETYDSICLRSTSSISRLTLLNNGIRWEILDHYEKGGTGITMIGGNTPLTTDTAWYVINNDQLLVHLKPMVDTSYSSYLGFSGFNSYYTIPGLDTSYSATAPAVFLDSGAVVTGVCVMKLNGSDVVCQKYDLTPFKGSFFIAGGMKGLLYGIQFTFTLPGKAPH